MLDVSYTRITGAGLMNIVNGVGKKRAERLGREKGLEWVNLVGCDGVGIDAIDLARRWGVRVDYWVHTGTAGKWKERKVRYGN